MEVSQIRTNGFQKPLRKVFRKLRVSQCTEFCGHISFLNIKFTCVNPDIIPIICVEFHPKLFTRASRRTVHVKEEKAIRWKMEMHRQWILSCLSPLQWMELSSLCLQFLKGKPEGSVEMQLPKITPCGIVLCVQKKFRMDKRTMQICYERVYKLNIDTCGGKSGFLLDSFACQNSKGLKDRMAADEFLMYMILLHYSGILQTCDVGVKISLKDWSKNCAAQG